MKCENCGYTTHPEDQVCIECGATLSLEHSNVPLFKQTELFSKKNRRKKYFLFFAFILILFILFFILRGIVL